MLFKSQPIAAPLKAVYVSFGLIKTFMMSLFVYGSTGFRDWQSFEDLRGALVYLYKKLRN